MEDVHGHDDFQAFGLVVNERINQTNSPVNTPANPIGWYVHDPKNETANHDANERVFFKKITNDTSPKNPFFQNWTADSDDDKHQRKTEVGK